jgi:hypothetical protein
VIWSSPNRVHTSPSFILLCAGVEK